MVVVMAVSEWVGGGGGGGGGTRYKPAQSPTTGQEQACHRRVRAHAELQSRVSQNAA